jgi:hypothetical protein
MSFLTRLAAGMGDIIMSRVWFNSWGWINRPNG